MTKPTDKFLANAEAISQLSGRSPHGVARAIEKRGIEPAGILEEHVLFDESALEEIVASFNTKKRTYTRTTPLNRKSS